MMPQDVILVAGPIDIQELESSLRDVDAGSSSLATFVNDYVNEPGLPSAESYDFVVDIAGVDQARTARRISHLLAKRGWAVLWFGAGPRVMFESPRHEAA